MNRSPQQFFRTLCESHFGGDERALRIALCSFAATLPQPERDILLQCDLGGRSAQSVGAQVGLCRRQVQRYRKSVRAKFTRHVTGAAPTHSPLAHLPALNHRDAHLQRRADMLARSLRGEPAKATAKSLGISVRTLWRERARIRAAAQNSVEQAHHTQALSRMLGDVEASWFRDDYHACSAAAQSAVAIARGLSPHGCDEAAALRFRAYIWGEVIERTVGSTTLADAYLAETLKAAEACTLDAAQSAFFTMRTLTQRLRDPAGLAAAYESIASKGNAMPELLRDIVQAEILDALDMPQALAPTLSRAAAADVAAAPRTDVARTRVAALGMCLRPGYARIARRCIADVRAWTRPGSRSALMTQAYEIFIFASTANVDRSVARLRSLAAHFRAAKLWAELATVLYLAARLCVGRGDPRVAGEFIEESLDAAQGRSGAKVQRDLLRYAALAFGGRFRERVANAFTEAMATAHDVVESEA